MSLETIDKSPGNTNNGINNPGNNTINHGNVNFDVRKITRTNRFEILARVNPFHDQLQLALDRTLEELYRNVDEGAEAVFVQPAGTNTDIAVVVQRLITVNLFGREYKVLKRLLRVVAPKVQHRGIGTALTNESIERLKPDAITGRTPNPYVFRADERSPYIGIIRPIHKLYTSTDRMILVAVLDKNTLAKINERTGVEKNAYPPGENRLFSLDRASQRSLDIYNRMTKSEPEGLGADLALGAGIRYLSMVNLNPRGSARFTPTE